jgi:CRP-like cAMP-binding protein
MITLDLFQNIRFFEAFPQSELQLIYPLTERRLFQSGADIRSQGDVNFDLYFLLDGVVDIIIDGQFVVSISDFGQLFGEMSIANHTTSTATVKAKTDVTMLVLNFQDLKSALPENLKDSILKNFYQACAEILAKKLISTNQIAKTFRVSDDD